MQNSKTDPDIFKTDPVGMGRGQYLCQVQEHNMNIRVWRAVPAPRTARRPRPVPIADGGIEREDFGPRVLGAVGSKDVSCLAVDDGWQRCVAVSKRIV